MNNTFYQTSYCHKLRDICIIFSGTTPCSSLSTVTDLMKLIRKQYDLWFQSLAAVEMHCDVQTINIDFRRHFNISKQIFFYVDISSL
jgi:hypothetical protein